MEKKKVLFTGQELQAAIDHLRTIPEISVIGLSRKFDKPYSWAYQVMETLEELGAVSEFDGKVYRKSLFYAGSLN